MTLSLRAKLTAIVATAAFAFVAIIVAGTLSLRRTEALLAQIEGRYVPKMMGKLQAVCAAYKGGTDLLAKFYVQILPQIPPRRGDEVSEYCVKMYQQAVEFFKKNGKAKEADAYELQLNRIKQGRG